MDATNPAGLRVLLYETEGLLHRLDGVRPLATQIPAVPAAAISPAAARAIDRFLQAGRVELRGLVHSYRDWLKSGQPFDPVEAQRRFSIVRLRFNRVLAHFETFYDAVVQRSQHDQGILLRGLDVLAEDALALGGAYYEPSTMITYLDRGIGAAIRKARTRLPGGGESPVAIIRIPRERMVGSGIGASLVHEVGHQAAASLNLLPQLRQALRQQVGIDAKNGPLWAVWERWISEIVADFWAVGALGVGATLGLMQVVSLPRPFVFRVHLDDPHPVPWLRVRLSCAMGQALYPHPQWQRVREIWSEFYPLQSLGGPAAEPIIAQLDAHLPHFVDFLLSHRPQACAGKDLRSLLPVAERQPARLAALGQVWLGSQDDMADVPPTLAMAGLALAKFDGKLPPRAESELHTRLLRNWALRSTLADPRRPVQVASPAQPSPLRRAA